MDGKSPINNDEKVSEGRQWLINWVQDNKWELANSLYKGNSRTHVDRLSGNQKCLDMVITNMIEMVTKVNCDEKYEATLYTVVS